MPATQTLPERRHLSPNLARLSARADGAPVIEGYAAVFYRAGDPGTEYRLWPDLWERIMPGAFDEAIREDDVRSFYNHDRNHMLGRSSSETLALSVDAIGLRYAATPPANLSPANLLELIERGDVDGSSFQFLADSAIAKRGKVVWTTEVIDGQTVDIREIHSLELFEVGPVVWQAYGGTTTGVRSRGELEALDLQRKPAKDARAALASASQAGAPPSEIEMRARQVEAANDLMRWRQ